MQLILVLGPQGSGKGTQSVLLSERSGIPAVSSGTLLRQEIAQGTLLGKEIEQYVSKGELVPVDLTAEIMSKCLDRAKADGGVILDGFPRSHEQAKAFDRMLEEKGETIDHVIHLTVPDEVSMRRISGRLVCTNNDCGRNYHVESDPPKQEGKCDVCGSDIVHRKDDAAETIGRRLAIYREQTLPLIERYRAQGLLREIDATGTIKEVHDTIIKTIGIGGFHAGIS